MRYGITELKEQGVLRKYVPSLFMTEDREMLYIGANQVRPPHHAGTLASYGWKLHLLEAYKGNIEFHGGNELWETVTWGNVTRRDELPKRTFDVVFWWHGCEHIPQDQLRFTLANIEDAATDLVVLGCPLGKYEQGPVYGNDLENHLWSVYPKDLEYYGYETTTYSVHVDHILAWKWI